jgi:hypothetical protein
MITRRQARGWFRTGFVRGKVAMNTTHSYVEYGLPKLYRVAAALRALRAEAEVAGRASTIAQLSHRNGRNLRELYRVPRLAPDDDRAARAVSSTSAGPRLQWIGQLGATAVAVCLLLVVVIVMVVPRMA